MPKFKPTVYIKDDSFDPIYKSLNFEFYFRTKFLPGIFVVLGILILSTQVVLPLIFFTTQKRVAPETASSVLGMATGFNEFEFRELTVSNTTATDETGKRSNNVPRFFRLTIPKLKIENAMVETNSTDLSPENTLGHYMGSALPGESGNAFVYGHSVLPWFYNPKNYKTIFSTLNKLETGDEIQIEYNNNVFAYRVEYVETEKPENVNPLAEFKPGYLNESTITLMTCWPAGSKAKRLMVRAVETN